MAGQHDQWAWWKTALDCFGSAKPIQDDGTVRSGFFWTKAARDGGRIPVAIWTALDGTTKCRWGAKASAKMIDEKTLLDRWPWVFPNPISREAYTTAYESGRWPDNAPVDSPTRTAGIGDNLPTDPKARLELALEAGSTWLREHPQAASQTEADYAINSQREIAAITKAADDAVKREVAPLLKQIDDIKERLALPAPLVDEAKAMQLKFRAFAEHFMSAEEARQKDEQRQQFEARRAAAEAERKRVEAERRKLEQDDPIAAFTSPLPPMPELPLEPEPIKMQAGGGVGRKAGLRSEWVGDIDDYQKCLAHFSEHPDIVKALEGIVKKTVKAGKGTTQIPGVTVREKRVVA